MAQTTYIRTLFDDSKYQLEGNVQSGAKWPAVLLVKPKVQEYKGYTSSYVRFIVRTNIDGDRNDGIIEAQVPVQDWYRIKHLIENLTNEDTKLPAIECYDRPFGRDKKPAKEDVLMARINLGVREGRVFIAVTDERYTERAKIPFYFGVPLNRTPKTVQGDKNDFMISKASALAWHDAISSILPAHFSEMQKEKVGGTNNNSSSNSYGGNNHSNNSHVDDDIPF